MRLNNLTARLLVNQWLAASGRDPIPGTSSYQEFATELRRRIAPKQVQVPFIDRADAVRYIREVAHQHRLFAFGTVAENRASRGITIAGAGCSPNISASLRCT